MKKKIDSTAYVSRVEEYIEKSKTNTFDIDKRRCWTLAVIDHEEGFILHNQSLRELRWDIAKDDKLVDYIDGEDFISLNWNYVTAYAPYGTPLCPRCDLRRQPKKDKE